MVDYIVCFIFWSIFIFFLYAFGNVLIKEEEAQSVKLMAGYLGYSFFVAVGGIIIQLANFKWSVFAVYMCIVLLGILLSILLTKWKRGKIFNCTLKEYIVNHWFIFVLCFILICMLFCYFRPYWYGNHLDDGYYLTKVATLPYEKNSFRMNYSVGVEKTSIDSYIFNTWELEASFFVKVLHVNAALFLRLFQSAFHYFILLNCILAFGHKILLKINKEFCIKNIQYIVGTVLIFFVYYVYLEDTGLFFIRDMFHLNSAMYYGCSSVKVIVVLFLLLFYIEQEKIDIRMIAGVGMISVVMISKTGVVLPVILVTTIACSLVWLLEKPNNKNRILAVIIGIIYIAAGIIIPAGVGEQKEVYKFVITAFKSPVVIVSFIIFMFSFTIKDKIVYRLNTILIISGILILVPQINDVFEAVSVYNFVAARGWSTYVYTFVIVNIFYLCLIFSRYWNSKIVKRIYLIISGILTILMIYGYSMDGGELFSAGELPARTNIREDVAKIYHNRYFIPNTTIELSTKLEELSGESKQQLVVVSPMWAGIDGTVHALSTQLRTYAPSIVSLSAIERYPVEENSKVYGYDQTKYDEFLNNPTEYSVRRFEKEIDKYEINCIIIQDNRCVKEMEEMGFVKKYAIQEGVYNVWYRAGK